MPPRYQNAQNRLNVLNTKIGNQAGGANANQQRIQAELARRAAVARSRGTAPVPTLPELGNKQQGLAGVGTDIATNRVNELGTPFNPYAMDTQTSEERRRIEDQVYGNLTRDVDVQQQQDFQEFEQRLQDKGIPYSDNPNSRYQMELKDHTRRFDDIRSNARAQATQLGGQEMTRNYNIAAGTRNINSGEIGGLSNLGLQGITSIEELSAADKDRILREVIANMAYGQNNPVFEGL